MTGTVGETDAWLSDDPIDADSPDQDLLGRNSFAASSVAMLNRLRAQSDSSVVALIGPWGAGKSSVLNMIRSGLTEENDGAGDNWIAVDFNPWNYQDLPSLQSGFFTELQAALPPGSAWSKARDSLAKIGRRVAPVGTLGSLIGLDASKIIETAANLIAGDESLSAARREAEEALRVAGRPVLMIVDDLDRLAPEELLLVFKLIRLTGRLPHIYYLVSYDEDTLLDALSRTGLVGKEDARRAVDYLEKIVQVRLDLPPLREHQISTWVDSALNGFAKRFQVSLGAEDTTRFGRAYHGHIRERLNTPRSIKRYFSQVEALFEPVKSEVDAVDFLLITWLRTAEPLVYELISARRAELLGTSSAWNVQSMLQKEGPAQKKELWRERLEAARVTKANLAGVADVLSQLFPRFEDAWQQITPDSRSRSATPGRVAHPDYFDRFFAFGVPPEDIPDAVVELAFHQIASQSEGPERCRVEAEFATKTSMIVGKIESLADIHKANLPSLLGWFTHRYHELDDELSFITPRHHVRWATQRIFLNLESAEALAAIEAASEVDEGLSLAANWMNAASKEEQFNQTAASSRAPARERFVQLIKKALDDHRDTSPLEIPDHIWHLLWEWRRLEEAEAGRWLRSIVDEGTWPVLDVVARLVGAQAPLGVPNPVWTLDALDVEAVDDLIGLDFAFNSLTADLDRCDGPPPAPRTVIATPESRRTFALAVLRQERDRRALGPSNG